MLGYLLNTTLGTKILMNAMGAFASAHVPAFLANDANAVFDRVNKATGGGTDSSGLAGKMSKVAIGVAVVSIIVGGILIAIGGNAAQMGKKVVVYGLIGAAVVAIAAPLVGSIYSIFHGGK